MDKKMKVAFLNFTQGSVERGAEIFVKELSQRLNRSCEVTIFSDKNKLAGRIPFLWRFYVDPQGIQVLLFTLDNIKAIFKNRFDVVIPLNGGWQSVLIRFVTYIYGGKMIISGQSGKGWDDKNNLWIFPDAFVALSTFLEKWAKKMNPLVRVEYIPNGVDTNRFRPVGNKVKYGLEGPIILCVGALTEEKRIHLVIKAVDKMKKGSLVVIGEGPLRKKLSELGEKILGERFLLTRSKYRRLPDYYRAADIFTLPSPSYRAFEIVIVEAMATNLPVVVNDDPIRREIVGDGGSFVNPEEVDEYAKVLEKALNLRWDNKPRKQAENFSWDKIAEGYEKLFKELKG